MNKNYQQGDKLFYYDGYVKNVRGKKIDIEILEPIILTKRQQQRYGLGVKVFKVRVVGITQDMDNDFELGYIFEPNSTTCFYTNKDYQEQQRRSYKFWASYATVELALVKAGKIKPKSIFD